MEKYMKRGTWILVASVILIAVFMSSRQSAQVDANPMPRPLFPNADPDLVIESIEYDPANPEIGESVDITMTIKNQGTAATGAGFRTYLYVDPDTEPPDAGTPDTSYTYYFGLNAGASYKWTYTDYIFSTEGPHSVWAWVDRDEDVTESDEDNNKDQVTINVGPDPDPGDTCDQAQTITTDGTTQSHTLAPVGDVDWFQFQAVEGVRYVLEADNVGDEADVIMELHNTCGGPPGFGGGQRIVWRAPVNGTYYVKIVHHDATYNASQSDYEISITAQDDSCSGHYEPNEACSASGDITPDGSVQHHSFCKAGDEDWVRFQGVAGTKYVIEATNPGADADVILELHNSCDAPPGFGSGSRIEWTCPANGAYYVKALNHNADKYGANATYDLTVTSLVDCQSDAFEVDDDAQAASVLTVNGTLQTHNVCPAGDEDWGRFTAAAGVTYTLETRNPASEADTYLCLYENDGTTEIACDDDGGAGKASRLIWQAPSPGDYLVKVRHYQSDVAGPDTQYDLVVSTDVCSGDVFEPDDSQNEAHTIPTDGSMQTHNICPSADGDWVRFQGDAGTSYVIQTSELGPEADTVLYLFNASGDQLAVNDDYDGGLASRLTYEFPTNGDYYVKVRHYDLTKFGSGTEYSISVEIGTPPPTPTPTPSPTPSPTPTPPPPSSIKTLIVVNRDRIASVYTEELADNLIDKLRALASHGSVQGEVLKIEDNTSIADAYVDWDSDLTDTDKANAVAATIRGLVMDYVNSHSEVEYIVLVGGDWIIPFRRVLDQTAHPESNYNAASRNTTVGAACGDDMSLTDDYYADKEPTVSQGRELYIPDFAVGRLVETPDEIIGVVDTFIDEHEITDVRALVTGYDFVQDAANEMCTTYRGDLGADRVDCDTIGSSWPGNDLKQKQLHANPPFRLQSINGHANHATEGAPDNDNVSASDVAAATADLRRALIHTVGCHSGMNVPPENSTAPLDLAQAFAQHQANYVANTGYGWGVRGRVGLSEKLMSNYATELVNGSQQPIGSALMRAKRLYYQQSQTLSVYDEKILMESTLYGLPQYLLNSGSAIRQRVSTTLFPSVNITTSLPAAFGGLQQGYAEIGLPQAFGTVDPEMTGDGAYYNLDGFVHTAVGEPMQPYFFASLSGEAGPLRGAVLRSARYQDETSFDPVIAAPTNEFLSTPDEPDFDGVGWYPAVPMSVHHTGLTTDTTSTLVTLMGQYDPRTDTERLFDHMAFDLYYSTSNDQEPATIEGLGGILDLETEEGRFKVDATDASGIHRVVVVYGEGDGQWDSVDLTWDSSVMKWTGTIITATQDTRFYVQVVDDAGNVTVASNKGAYYRLGLGLGLEPFSHDVFLPLVLKD